MREIKFRVWDSIKNIMLPVIEVSWEPLQVVRWVICWDKDEGDCCTVQLPKEGDLMQFTGLHDKNGKEIWEGDIIQDKKDKRFRGKIWYDDKKAMFCYEELSLAEAINAGLLIKVIGNIYENPELLKEGK